MLLYLLFDAIGGAQERFNVILTDLGERVANLIFSVAESVAEKHIPGLVSLGFAIALGVALFLLARGTRHNLAALRDAEAAIASAKDEKEFSAKPDLVSDGFEKLRGRHGKAGAAVAEAWDEYKETIVVSDLDDKKNMRNGLRPGLFFNPEDLGMAPGFWRIVPGLFVSLGLALTFLGLIAVLHKFSGKMDVKDSAMTTAEAIQLGMPVFIATASAKFIMSLTGLFCSIIFTIGLRTATSALDKRLLGLCRKIEKRLTFVSLEELADKQLAAISEQTEQMKHLNIELVEGLARPLREEIPAAISAAIATEIRPLMASLGQTTSSGMESMMGDLSSRISGDVGEALSIASTRLSDAADRLGQLSGALEGGSGRMGAEFEGAIASLSSAVEKMQGGMQASADTTAGAFSKGAEEFLAAMNQSLDRIGENTAQSNASLTKVADALVSAAGNFSTEVETASADARRRASEAMDVSSEGAARAVAQAGASVLQSFDEAIAATAEKAKAMSGKAGQDLLKPLEDLRDRLDEIVTRAAAGASHMSSFADGAERGAAAVGDAATGLRASSDAFQAAAGPLRSMAERTEAAAARSAEASTAAAQAVGRSAEEVAASAARALDAALQVAQARAQATDHALQGIAVALTRFKDVADRYDELDENLGKAFEIFRTKVEEAMDDVSGSAKEVHDLYAGALDTLREVVDDARTFAPEQRRR
jgi:hypothetical protein